MKYLSRIALLGLAVLTACSTPQKTTQAPPPLPTPPAVVVAPPQPAPPPAPVVVAPPVARPEITSSASTPRAYRRDGAEHLYRRNSDRIYRGQLPPLLQAVGVTRIQIDALGRILGIEWMRAPSHVPAVMAEIERTIRAAAPFPAPIHLGQVSYVDTWLWDQSGRFQLDTLTEGQRDRR